MLRFIIFLVIGFVLFFFFRLLMSALRGGFHISISKTDLKNPTQKKKDINSVQEVDFQEIDSKIVNKQDKS
jgi:hypothetical protein